MENNQTYQPQMTNLGGGVNYQMQIVTKLPNENILTYQLQMIYSRRGQQTTSCNVCIYWMRLA